MPKNNNNNSRDQYRKSGKAATKCGARKDGRGKSARNSDSNVANTGRGANDTFRKPEDDTSVRFTNEPTYYYTNKEVTDGALRIPYNLFAGTQYKIGTSSFKPVNVLVYHMYPTPTHSWESDDSVIAISRESGIDWAAQRLYTALSSVNGKTTNYTPPTLSIMMLAMGEVISMYSFIRRAFGYAYSYSRRNWGVPFCLFKAMGIDWADFRENIADYLTQFNTIVADMNKIPILSNVTYFQKCADMYNYVYQDDESPMAQLELMVPDYTWFLEEDSAVRAGSILKTVATPCANDGAGGTFANTMQGWLDILRTQVYKLMMSSTLNVVYSDVYNYVFKKGMQIDHLPAVASDYHLDSIYNIEWKNTMHNARVLGRPVQQPDMMGKTITTRVYTADETFSDLGSTNWNDVWERSDGSGIVYTPLSYIKIRKIHANTDVMPYPDNIDYHALNAIAFDTSTPELTLEQKVEYTRYTTPYTIKGCQSPAEAAGNGSFINLYTYAVAPGDHSIADVQLLVPSGYSTADGATFTTAGFADIVTPDIFASAARVLSIDKSPMFPAFDYRYNITPTDSAGTPNGWIFLSYFSDLECLTTLNPDTLVSANRLIERDLFDVRDLKQYT